MTFIFSRSNNYSGAFYLLLATMKNKMYRNVCKLQTINQQCVKMWGTHYQGNESWTFSIPEQGEKAGQSIHAHK